MRINVDYNIIASPWWIPSYTKSITPESVAKEIVRLRKVIERNRADSDPIIVESFEGYKEAHRLVYLKELLLGEGIFEPQEDSMQYIEQLLSEEISANMRLTQKVRNIDGVVRHYFPDIFFPPFNLTRFTPDFICALHAEAMKGLLDNAGEYRVRLLLFLYLLHFFLC